MVIVTPDRRLRVFVSSTIQELADERAAAREAIEALHLSPILFELGARPYPPRALYSSYLEQSDIFVGIYWQRYGWVAPDMDISGLEDEFNLAATKPRLLYLKQPDGAREGRLDDLLDKIKNEGGVSFKTFRTADELRSLLADDLAILLTERFHTTADLPRPAHPAGLPAATTSFIGRARELTEVATLLANRDVRLLSLTGPGGIGKTRLAVEIARAASPMFPGGTLFVPLAGVQDPDLLLPTIAASVGVREAGPEPLLAVVARALRDEPTLMVLDNLEQVTPGAQVLCDLLAVAPDVKMLATTRQLLRLSPEHAYTVQPLTTPAPDMPAEQIGACDAVRLFGERARAMRAGVTFEAGELEAVGEICRRLDGLPLAIELAAARTRLLAPTAILARLGSALDVGGGPRDLPERQRTLRATMRWSYDLLEPEERRFFAHLAVFSGSTSVEAVESVCNVDGTLDVLALIESLLDKSLIRLSAADETRIEMVDIVRAFAAELLADAPDVEQIRERHIAHFHELCLAGHAGLRGPHQRRWMGTLEADADNLRSVLTTLLTQGRMDEYADVEWTVWFVWWVRGRLTEGRRWSTEGLASPAPRTDRANAIMLGVDSLLALWQGDYMPAMEHGQQALDIYESIGDQAGVANLLMVTSMMTVFTEGTAAAMRMITRSLELFRRVDDPWGISSAFNVLCWIKLAADDVTAQDAAFSDAVEAAERVGDDLMMAMAYTNMGEREMALGDLARARPWLDRGIELLTKVGTRYSLPYAIDDTATYALRKGDPRFAAEMLGAADAGREKITAPLWGARQAHRDRDEAALRAALGEDYEQVHARGRTIDLDEAAARAMAFLAAS